MCTIPEFQPYMAAKRCSSCYNTTASIQMLTYDQKWPWRGRESELVIFLPRTTWDPYLEGSSVITLLWLDLFALLYFSMVFQCRGHDLVSDLRSPQNKKTLDMHIVIVHGLTVHIKFQNHQSQTASPSRGPSLTCITSIDRIWWPDLTRTRNLTKCVGCKE